MQLHYGKGLYPGGGSLNPGGGGVPKWAHNVVEFLQGKKKVKPSHIVKGIGKVFKIASSIAKMSPKYSKYSDKLDKAGNISNTIGDKVSQLGSGPMTYGTGKSIQYGSGFKKVTKDFIDFLQGKKKITPTGILRAGGVIANVMAAGAIATGVGAPVGAALTALSTGLYAGSEVTRSLSTTGRGVSTGGLNSRMSRICEKAKHPGPFKQKFSKICKKFPGDIVTGKGKGGCNKKGGELFPVRKLKQDCKKSLMKQGYNRNTAGRICKDQVAKEFDRLKDYKIDTTNVLRYGGKGGTVKRYSKYGTRSEVWNGTKQKTRGGLTKSDLMQNGRGKIISKKCYMNYKKRFGK